MIPTLTLLGGSTPFTAGLIDALDAANAHLPAYRLMLHGRDHASLELVARYAEARLGKSGWQVFSSSSLEQALTGAAVVIHQIRYGSMIGREADEEFCANHGVAADETLGPGALLRAMQQNGELHETGRIMSSACPDAWVLNLTNPLSCVTATLTEIGVQRCVGLCELPWVTLQEAAGVLAVPPDELQWSYSGLNHRGFIHQLRYRGEDALATIAHRLNGRCIGGIGAKDITHLDAIPLKYFRLVMDPVPKPVRRAAFLAELRQRICEELESCSTIAPPSLRERYLEWYPQAVVPMLVALNSAKPHTVVVNVSDANGIVRECKAHVCRSGVTPLPEPPVNDRVHEWLETFENHERAFVAAVQAPTERHVRHAVAADPTVARHRTETLTRALWREFTRRTDRSEGTHRD